MRQISRRWIPARAAVGALLLSIGSGIRGFQPRFSFIAGIIFAVGLMVVASAVVHVSRRPLVIHNEWDTKRVEKSLSKAPANATIRILQTWFPEENFVDCLEREILHHDKQFDLRILLLEADIGPDETSDLLAARIQLRGVNRKKAAEEILTCIAQLVGLKTKVDETWQQGAVSGIRPRSLDLQIRRYNFLPFGPIYQIGPDVMYVGFFIAYATSLNAPMLEVRNTPDNPVWRTFERQLNDAWSDQGSKQYYPPPADGPAGPG
jgi:hypothetical protein